jgi:hypothetical protein
MVEGHCLRMKAIAVDIIQANDLIGVLVPTEYVNEHID